MEQHFCLACGKEIPWKGYSYNHKYCDNKCQQNLARQQTHQRLLEGQIAVRGTIRKALKRIEHKCSSCGLTEWLGQPIPLEVDHIDGNAGNNSYNNVRLLCPNCHGLTDTWKGRNRGSGRAARGLPLS